MVAGITLLDQVRNFVDFLADRDLIISTGATMLSSDGTELSWYPRPGGEPFLVSRAHHSAENWRNWVDSGAFTAMLFDGSLLQITFRFEGERVVGHRLAYVPCPYADTDHVIDLLSLDEFVEYYESDAKSLQLKTTIRFDYAPDDAAVGHPSTHLTINNADTRIACAGPLSFDQFITFVFSNFYPELADVSEYFRSLPSPGKFDRTISKAEEALIHLNWAA